MNDETLSVAPPCGGCPDGLRGDTMGTRFRSQHGRAAKEVQVTESFDSGTDRDPLLDRAHVAGVLRRAGLGPEQIVTVLDGLEFPSRLSRVLLQASQYGISREWLIDRMGGSP